MFTRKSFVLKCSRVALGGSHVLEATIINQIGCNQADTVSVSGVSCDGVAEQKGLPKTL